MDLLLAFVVAVLGAVFATYFLQRPIDAYLSRQAVRTRLHNRKSLLDEIKLIDDLRNDHQRLVRFALARISECLAFSVLGAIALGLGWFSVQVVGSVLASQPQIPESAAFAAATLTVLRVLSYGLVLVIYVTGLGLLGTSFLKAVRAFSAVQRVDRYDIWTRNAQTYLDTLK